MLNQETHLETDLLFVYGSLRPKYDHSLSKEFEGYIGQGRAAGKMYRISWFPGVIFKGESKVVGDVVKLKGKEHLKHLDAFEGVHGNPPLYNRIKVEVVLDSSKKTVTCWAYEFARPIEETKHKEILSGDFLVGT
jgi:gamma-glutamylcyclotransferase (GGCT)/AIG2-like uncharacterized protein YtfP